MFVCVSNCADAAFNFFVHIFLFNDPQFNREILSLLTADWQCCTWYRAQIASGPNFRGKEKASLFPLSVTFSSNWIKTPIYRLREISRLRPLVLEKQTLTFYVYTTNLMEWPSSTYWVSWLLSFNCVVTFCCSRQVDSQNRPLRWPRHSSTWPTTLTFDPDLWPWTRPLNLTPTFDTDLKKTKIIWWHNMFFAVWPWPLTYDLDLQSRSK